MIVAPFETLIAGTSALDQKTQRRSPALFQLVRRLLGVCELGYRRRWISMRRTGKVRFARMLGPAFAYNAERARRATRSSRWSRKRFESESGPSTGPDRVWDGAGSMFS